MKMGSCSNAVFCDLSDIVPADKNKELKHAAEISMWTEVSECDLENIQYYGSVAGNNA